MEFFNKLKHYFLLILDPNFYSVIYIKLLILLILFTVSIEYNYFFVDKPLLLDLLRVIMTYIVLNLFFNYFRLIIIYFYLRKNKFTKGYFDNFVLGINKISFFLNHAVFFLIFVHLFVINLIQLLTTISIVAVALVLIFKDYISNFFNGIFIMFSDEIRLNDYVRIGDFKGKVTNLTLKNIELISENGNYIYIPNTLAFSKEIINYSKGLLKVIRHEFCIPSKYYKNYSKIKKEIHSEIHKNFKDIISSKENISIRIDRNEKDQIYTVFDIIVSRYNYKIELNMKNFISEKMIEMLAKSK